MEQTEKLGIDRYLININQLGNRYAILQQRCTFSDRSPPTYHPSPFSPGPEECLGESDECTWNCWPFPPVFNISATQSKIVWQRESWWLKPRAKEEASKAILIATPILLSQRTSRPSLSFCGYDGIGRQCYNWCIHWWSFNLLKHLLRKELMSFAPLFPCREHITVTVKNICIHELFWTFSSFLINSIVYTLHSQASKKGLPDSKWKCLGRRWGKGRDCLKWKEQIRKKLWA